MGRFVPDDEFHLKPICLVPVSNTALRTVRQLGKKIDKCHVMPYLKRDKEDKPKYIKPSSKTITEHLVALKEPLGVSDEAIELGQHLLAVGPDGLIDWERKFLGG